MNAREVIGLVPAAGWATRVAPLPCSKEIYPVELRSVGEKGGVRPKVVSHYLLEKMRLAGVRKAFMVLRDGKWDIPAYYNDGTALLDVHLAYLLMRVPYGPPYTLDQAHPFLQHATVALGFPDILFQPHDAFVNMLSRLDETNADVVLGLFPSHRADQVDMVDVGDDGRIRNIVIKSRDTALTQMWLLAVWTPAFTNFMHEHLAEAIAKPDAAQRELFVGDAFQAAIDTGLHVNSVFFPDGKYLDVGIPENLASGALVEFTRA
jgi:glucose-1-phosphate thymidylyltransferase